MLDRMDAFADAVRGGRWLGHTGKRIRNVVNIGIGGSDLGPVMAYEALRFYSDRDLTLRFVSNVDATDLVEATRDLDAAETLFIVCSKTFTTLETLTNAHAARDWSVGQLGDDKSVAQHFVAVSTNGDGRAEVRHRAGEHVRLLGLGRRPLLDGFGDRPVDADRHRPRTVRRDARRLPRDGRALPQRADRAQTCRRCSRLLAIWNNNFLGAATLAVLPYEQYLKRLPAYLQQLTMESNGKHVRLDGKPVDVETAPVLWGEPGTNGQHSFYQLIHQGTRLVPCDFIGFAQGAESARPSARPADVEPVRADRGARLRQDRGAGGGRRHAGRARAASRLRRQPADQHHSRRAPHAA